MNPSLPRRLARWLPAAGWYAVIWFFSAQNGVESQNVSDGVLTQLFHYDILNSPLVLSGLLSFLVRKAAHMGVFFVLTGLLVFALKGYVQRPAVQAVAAISLCAALAAVDEFHQTFVPGRSGLPRDVVIDLCGGAVFLLCWWVFRKIQAKRAQKKEPAEART